MRFGIPVKDWLHQINSSGFEAAALELFNFQKENCPVYSDWLEALKLKDKPVNALSSIPFLPISFFRTHHVRVRFPSAETVLEFHSSGTTGSNTSVHYIEPEWYKEISLAGFKAFYGDPKQYLVLALLPSYLEQGHSSLVYMVKMLMEQSGHAGNTFFKDETERLHQQLQASEQAGIKTILFGVTYALLDFAAQFPMSLKHTTIIETGGMKGRKEEWTRERVHTFLKEKLNLENVHSEYGMTELCSQAWSKESGIYQSSASMKVLVRDPEDPLTVREQGSGLLNIIDLGNADSCAFIATDDIGNIHPDRRFEVLGRWDHSILRGCSQLMI